VEPEVGKPVLVELEVLHTHPLDQEWPRELLEEIRMIPEQGLLVVQLRETHSYLAWAGPEELLGYSF